MFSRLPYSKIKRRVIYQNSEQNDPIFCKPKNLIVRKKERFFSNS